MHIEFVGVSGVGKSTIYNNILKNKKFYGGYHEGALFRSTIPVIKQPNDIFPDRFKKCFKKLFWKCKYKEYYKYFIKSFPEYDHYRNKIINDRLSYMLKQTASRYQIGKKTVRKDEILCMDEGFYQRAASIGVRRNPMCIPDNMYFSSFPSPDLLVHVTSENEIIKKRLKLRDDNQPTSDYINRNKKLIDSICKVAKRSNVDIINVKNAGDINTLIKSVEQTLNRYLDHSALSS